MDFTQAATFFDRQKFDVYDFTAGAWVTEAFAGQIKKADSFISMWNRATRKRMLYLAPANESALGPVVRVSGSNEIYMVGTPQRDFHENTHYRTTCNIQHIKDNAIVRRRAPIGPPNDPGWAVNTVVATTFGDVELRSSDEEQERRIKNYGSFFLFMPSNTELKRQDTVDVGRDTYFVVETYNDSGLSCARATIRPDDRIDVVYIAVGTPVYDTATSEPTSTDDYYNVTGRLTPTENEDSPNSLVNSNFIYFQILKTWIGVKPKINDKIEYDGVLYTIRKVKSNSLTSEWYIEAEA